MTPAVSVVIPVYRDDPALERLLERLDRGTGRPDEIVIVRGDAEPGDPPADGTGTTKIVRAAANRGAQLDAGARAASGDVLWFLHADAEPPEDAIRSIAAAVAAGAESGCFRFEFAGPRRGWMWLLERLIALRIAAGGMVYGDQGIFATRAAYRAAGGFAASPLFEEVGLVRGLRRRGTFVRLRDPILVSPRRWERDGWWRRTLHNRWLATCYMLGVPATELARRYRRPLAARGGSDE